MTIHGPERVHRDVAAIALRYRRAVMAFFLRRVREPFEAEDLTQYVFASLSRRATAEPIETVEGHDFQIAAILLRDRARRARARPAIESEGRANPDQHLVDELSPEREFLGREA